MYITYLIDASNGEIVDANADNEFSGDWALQNVAAFIKNILKTNRALVPQPYGEPLNPAFLLVVEKRNDKKDENYIFPPQPLDEKEIIALRKVLPNMVVSRKYMAISQPMLLIKTRHLYRATF